MLQTHGSFLDQLGFLFGLMLASSLVCWDILSEYFLELTHLVLVVKVRVVACVPFYVATRSQDTMCCPFFFISLARSLSILLVLSKKPNFSSVHFSL